MASVSSPPRDGLFLYGPVGDTKELPAIRYGVIGTPGGAQRLSVWAKTISGFIDIPPPGPRLQAVEPQHVPFPGFVEAFHADWPIDPPCLIDDLDAAEIERTLPIANHHEAICNTVDLFVCHLVAENMAATGCVKRLPCQSCASEARDPV